LIAQCAKTIVMLSNHAGWPAPPRHEKPTYVYALRGAFHRSRRETSPREAPVTDTQCYLLETVFIGVRRKNERVRGRLPGLPKNDGEAAHVRM
jgi:hypothetical protein